MLKIMKIDHRHERKVPLKEKNACPYTIGLAFPCAGNGRPKFGRTDFSSRIAEAKLAHDAMLCDPLRQE